MVHWAGVLRAGIVSGRIRSFSLWQTVERGPGTMNAASRMPIDFGWILVAAGANDIAFFAQWRPLDLPFSASFLSKLPLVWANHFACHFYTALLK